MTPNQISDKTQLLGKTVLTQKIAQFPEAECETLQWYLARIWGVWVPTEMVIDAKSDQDYPRDQERCKKCWDADPHDSEHHDLTLIAEMAHLKVAIEGALEAP